MTTRMIGGVIMTHGDDKGLVLPPLLAPYQVVIVPIGRGEQAEQVLPRPPWSWPNGCAGAGIRAHVDNRPQLSPGFKFNDWELRGVPIRLELGPRDLADGHRADGHPARRGQDRRSRWTRRPARLAVRAGRVPGPAAASGRPSSATRTPVTVDTWDEFAEAVATGWALAFHCGQPRVRGRDQGRDLGHRRAASRRRARRSRACASAAACRPPTASGSSSAGPTERARASGRPCPAG